LYNQEWQGYQTRWQQVYYNHVQFDNPDIRDQRTAHLPSFALTAADSVFSKRGCLMKTMLS